MNTTDKPTKMSSSAENAAAPATLSAARLLGPAKAVVIEYKGERYTLRLTRNDKLILTK